MLDQLKSLAIFSKVVDTGSFRGAAKVLSLSPSVVSHHISRLENHVGAALLYRSTRAVSLTNDGERLHVRTKRLVQAAEDSMELFSEGARSRLVDLRIAIPATLCAHPVFDRITGFTKQRGGIRLSIISSDRPINLFRDAIDVAIRMGNFADSEMKSKTVGTERAILVGSPDYVASRPVLRNPAELKGWDFISFLPVPDRIDVFGADRKSSAVWGNTVAATDSIETLRKLVLGGVGISLIPYSNARPDLKSKVLEHICPGVVEKLLPITVVWPRNAALSGYARAFIEHMSQA